MSWFTGLMVYLIVWWLVFFTVLPFGVRAPERVEPGHDGGAPDKPGLWRKALIATLVSAVLFAGVYWLIESELLSFRTL